MTNDILDDLKQFIDGRLSQSEARYDKRFDVVEARLEKFDAKVEQLDAKAERLDAKIDSKIDGLRDEMLAGFDGVADSIAAVYDNLGYRVTKLEQVAVQAAV